MPIFILFIFLFFWAVQVSRFAHKFPLFRPKFYLLFDFHAIFLSLYRLFVMMSACYRLHRFYWFLIERHRTYAISHSDVNVYVFFGNLLWPSYICILKLYSCFVNIQWRRIFFSLFWLHFSQVLLITNINVTHVLKGEVETRSQILAEEASPKTDVIHKLILSIRARSPAPKKTQNTSFALLSQNPFWYKNIVVYPFCSPEKRIIFCTLIWVNAP